MGDAWDDDDFEVAPLDNGASGGAAAEWDDEEEFEPPPLPSHGDAPKLSKDKAAKVKAMKEAQKRAAIESALQEDETDADRRLRERHDIEDADHALADDLFAGTGEVQVKVVQGLEGYELKLLKDYVTLAHDIGERFDAVKAKSNFQSKFIKEVLKHVQGSLSIDDCDEIMGICAMAKAEKEKAKRQPTAKKNAQKKPQKTKKEMKEEKKKHEDLFGGFVENEYQSYEDEYDDFM